MKVINYRRLKTSASGGTYTGFLTITVPSRLFSIDWSGSIQTVTNQDDPWAQIRMQAVSDNNSNDVPMLSEVRASVNLLTSGAYLGTINKFVLLNWNISPGSRIYIHSNLTSAGTFTIAAVLGLEENPVQPRRR